MTTTNGPVGFVGLGVMGAPMAANLVAAGFDVVGYNRSPAPMRALVAAGGRVADDVASLSGDCPVVVTMLPDDAAVGAVHLGEAGVLANARPGALVVDMSTVSPMLSQELFARGRQLGLRVLDAPVSGGQQGAVEAVLSVMVGGSRDAFDAAMPIFSAVGKTVLHVGGPGAGQTVKAANQLLVGGIIELVAEAILFLEAQDVDLTAAIQVLAGGLAGNRILDRKADGMIARQFTPGFRIDLHHKDMGILLAAAREANVPLPLGGLVAQLFVAARARGDGSLDHTALLRLLEAGAPSAPGGAIPSSRVDR